MGRDSLALSPSQRHLGNFSTYKTTLPKTFSYAAREFQPIVVLGLTLPKTFRGFPEGRASPLGSD